MAPSPASKFGTRYAAHAFENCAMLGDEKLRMVGQSVAVKTTQPTVEAGVVEANRISAPELSYRGRPVTGPSF